MNRVGQAVEVGDHRPVGECRHGTQVRFDRREGQGGMAGPLALGEVEVGPDGLSRTVDGEGILGRGQAFRVIPAVLRRSCRLGQRSVCPAMIGPCSWRAH
jgi:hypothetical protein